jgi:hypothetical protein
MFPQLLALSPGQVFPKQKSISPSDKFGCNDKNTRTGHLHWGSEKSTLVLWCFGALKELRKQQIWDGFL